MIETDRFYDATVVGARWYEGEDGADPTLSLRLQVGEDTINRYLYTDSPDAIDRMKRELKALGVGEELIYTEDFTTSPYGVIGAVNCRIKTRTTKTGKVAVGYICDPQAAKPLSGDSQSRLMAKLKGAAPATPAPAQEVDDALPF